MRSEAEEESQSPKDIALAVFRFRARRGTGVFYALLSAIPLFTIFLNDLSVPSYAILISTVAASLGIWLIARAAGLRRFTQMSSTIDLVEGEEEERRRTGSRSVRFFKDLVTHILPIRVLPLAVFVILEIYGMNRLAVTVLFAWIVGLVSYNILVFSEKSKNRIIFRRVEDWVVVLSLLALLLLSALPIVGSLIDFSFLSPILLAAGVKSLYEAPEELVRGIE
jgi:hypothetical protein